ncbi:hypothetical protein [Paracoccus mutanolyticus]|uniref:hypothetical protein n=1 Tax=Paracoccus mutanolyticus TaxID=1499308 RepID=UPI001CB8E324|nr:hypothetical protein [Paracoccus mutanolyticus]
MLRRGGRADALLAPMLARRPRPEIRRILRLAVVEMLALGEAPLARSMPPSPCAGRWAARARPRPGC